MNNIIKTDNAYVEATKKAFFEKLPEKIQKWAVLAPESADPNKYLYDRTIGVDGVQVPISTEGQIAANKELRQHNVPKTKPQAIPQEDTSTSPQLNSAPMKATPDTEPDGSGGVKDETGVGIPDGTAGAMTAASQADPGASDPKLSKVHTLGKDVGELTETGLNDKADQQTLIERLQAERDEEENKKMENPLLGLGKGVTRDKKEKKGKLISRKGK